MSIRLLSIYDINYTAKNVNRALTFIFDFLVFIVKTQFQSKKTIHVINAIVHFIAQMLHYNTEPLKSFEKEAEFSVVQIA